MVISIISLVNQPLPSGEIGIHLLFAVPRGINFAAWKPDDKIAFLVGAVDGCSGGVLAVSAQDALGDQRQFSQDRGVPLHDVILQEKKNNCVSDNFFFSPSQS